MAGGMQRGRSGRSLQDRAGASGVGGSASGVGSSAPGAGGPTSGVGGSASGMGGSASGMGARAREGRHCWVHDPPEAAGTWPGLLVEWRQRDGGWQGRVVYAVTGPHGAALVEAWLPAARLEPR